MTPEQKKTAKECLDKIREVNSLCCELMETGAVEDGALDICALDEISGKIQAELGK